MKRGAYRIFITLAVLALSALLLVAAGYMYKKYRPERFGALHIEEGSAFSIHFFDVGEGDSALVACDGHYMLIDGGDSTNSSFLYSFLRQHHIAFLDYAVCTHAHADHVGGLAGALKYAKVGTAFAPVKEYDSKSFESFVRYLEAQGKDITIPSPGDTFHLGSAEVAILGPVDMRLAQDNVNNSSIVLRIVYGNTSFLFTGDAEKEEELSIVGSRRRIRSTLIKVGHHGSNSSSSAKFMAAVRPKVAVISVGKDNDYNHPHDAAIKRIQKYAAEIYRTDLQGGIVCTSDGSSLSITTERHP